MVALTAYGNDYLQNGSIPMAFDSLNTTFQFCNKVTFRELRKMRLLSKSKKTVVANNPTEWFKYLRVNGCKQLSLYRASSKNQAFEKDHKLAGLVGEGGSWLIETVYDNYSFYLTSGWEVTNQNAADNKIWTVNYSMLHKQQHISKMQIDELLINDEIRRTLTKISDFAKKQNLQRWAEQFDKAKSALDSSSPEENYFHKDLIPLTNYSLEAKQLLFSAGIAWVFGGMGSWSDVGFDNQEDNAIYDRLSERLYSNINDAIIAAINTVNSTK